MREILGVGARGYVLTSDRDLVGAVKAIGNHESYLRPVAQGYREIWSFRAQPSPQPMGVNTGGKVARWQEKARFAQSAESKPVWVVVFARIAENV